MLSYALVMSVGALNLEERNLGRGEETDLRPPCARAPAHIKVRPAEIFQTRVMGEYEVCDDGEGEYLAFVRMSR